jgi:hypothetical protein
MKKSPSGPSCYLVVAVCNFDDIPIAIVFDEAKAIERARKTGKPNKNSLESWDITGFIGAKVLRFVKGRPTKLVFNSVGEET